MNISIFLMGVLFLAFFIVPVIYIHRAQKNKGKKFLKNFAELALKDSINISDCDMWNESNCIGIDKTNGKIFVLHKTQEKEETIQIDLKSVSECKLSPTFRKVKGNKNGNITERIDLVFNFNDSSTEKVINFYNINGNASLADEQILAEKWLNKVSAYIKN